MSFIPAFSININAESTSIYHTDPIFDDRADYVSGNGEDGETVWTLPRHQATVIESRTRYPGLSACRMTTTLRNDGDRPFTVDALSSAVISNIGKPTAEGRTWDDHRFIVHYAHMVWQGEAQWRAFPLEDLGVYPTYNHGHQRTFIIKSQGSWSTSRYYPLLLLEDTARRETHYFEIHSSSSWQIELGIRGYKTDSTLAVTLTAALDENDGWFYELTPGESYTTAPCVTGTVLGGFEEAVAELTAYKRMTSKTAFPGGHVPVCFNDYMNCLWAQPSRDRLMPLIESAASAGCEVFCIDAGWFGETNNWSMHNGDWQPNDALFGEGGLRGIINEIASRGMKPGVWLELETVDSRSDFAKAHPEALLTRHGHPVGYYQCFMDFRLPVVREHLMQVFDDLYAMGVRYVKNDYNHTTAPYIDAQRDASGAEAYRANAAAFHSFIDEVLATHEGFMIENCNSGANRCDHESLSHFHLQSTSDQEFCERYPSIIQGMLAVLPPERAGIWAYPYPVDFHDRIEQMEMYPVVSPSVAHMIDVCSDGTQTAFNMVNGLMGALYLSGRICYADELNRKLIHDAIAIYKENRPILEGAVPVYPQGQIRLSGTGHTSLGLLNRKAGKLLLAVWQIVSADPTETTIDLGRYITPAAQIARVYPTLPGHSAELSDGRLHVTFDEGNCAMYIEIDLL